jgi:hypothetical protein
VLARAPRYPDADDSAVLAGAGKAAKAGRVDKKEVVPVPVPVRQAESRKEAAARKKGRRKGRVL